MRKDEDTTLVIVDKSTNELISCVSVSYPDRDSDNSLVHKAVNEWMFYSYNREEIAYLKWLFVNEDYRGNGLQRLLIELTEAIAEMNGRTFVFAKVDMGNPVSLRNFLAAGYESASGFPINMIVQILKKRVKG